MNYPSSGIVKVECNHPQSPGVLLVLKLCKMPLSQLGIFVTSLCFCILDVARWGYQFSSILFFYIHHMPFFLTLVCLLFKGQHFFLAEELSKYYIFFLPVNSIANNLGTHQSHVRPEPEIHSYQ